MVDEIYPDHEGYYWIKQRFFPMTHHPEPFDQWVIAYWRDEEYWEGHGEPEPLDMAVVLELGDEIEKPKKYCT